MDLGILGIYVDEIGVLGLGIDTKNIQRTRAIGQFLSSRYPPQQVWDIKLMNPYPE